MTLIGGANAQEVCMLIIYSMGLRCSCVGYANRSNHVLGARQRKSLTIALAVVTGFSLCHTVLA